MIKVKAFAKLNLNLHLLPKKPDNDFYPTRFINCQLDLFDTLMVEKIKNKIEIICNCQDIPTEKNLILRAAILLKKITRDKSLGVRVILKKNIPVKAGFGGGSSDAAETIKLLTKLWKIKLTNVQRLNIISQLGNDVFYCLVGGVCEVLEKQSVIKRIITKIPEMWTIIITPEATKPSTGWMYSKLDPNRIGKNLDKFKKMKIAIIKRDKKEIINNLSNDFEELASRNFPVISSIKKDFLREKAKGAILAGSGLSMVGFFNSKTASLKAFTNLKVKYNKIFYARTI